MRIDWNITNPLAFFAAGRCGVGGHALGMTSARNLAKVWSPREHERLQVNYVVRSQVFYAAQMREHPAPTDVRAIRQTITNDQWMRHIG